MAVVDPPLSKCPHCGARGVRVIDRPMLQGFVIFADYCGRCGKNWPNDIEEQAKRAERDGLR